MKARQRSRRFYSSVVKEKNRINYKPGGSSCAGAVPLVNYTDTIVMSATSISEYLGVVLVRGVQDVRGSVHADGAQHLELAQPLQPVQPEPVCRLHDNSRAQYLHSAF
jgi:hypothetical protein